MSSRQSFKLNPFRSMDVEDRLEPIGPPTLLPQEIRRTKETTIKITFCQGVVLFACLTVLFSVIMCASVYVGYWINRHDEDDFGLILTAGLPVSPSSSASSSQYVAASATFLVPLHVDTSTCSKEPPSHPLGNLVGAVGAVLGKRFRVCGGRVERTGTGENDLGGGRGNESLAECRTLNRRKWVIKHEGDSGLMRMTTGRAFAAAAVVSDIGWWVTGGVDSKDNLIQTTEIVESVSIDPKFEGGPLLPEANAKHCLVRLTATRVMLIGGTTASEMYSTKTWHYDWQDRKDRWTGRASLGQGRHSHSCFGYLDKVVVAGGAMVGWEEEGSDSAEVYDMDEDAWRAITALPNRMKGGFAFSWGSEPTLAGGSDRMSMIKFHEDDGWITSDDRRLPAPVRYPVAITTKMSWICD